MHRLMTILLFPLLMGAGAAHLAQEKAPWIAPDPEKLKKNPQAADAGSIARGRELYERQCQSCHGETGTGDGPIAERLGFSPGDLTDAEAMGGQTDGEIFWKIATGRDAMPGFKTVMGLDDQQIWDLVNHTRSLAIRPKVKNDE